MEKFFECGTCGNVAGLLTDKGVPLFCCGKAMTLLEANTVDASHEKHLPEATKAECGLCVKVGSTLHPMTAEHYIDFVFVKTSNGGKFVKFDINAAEPPETCLGHIDCGGNPIEVYAYCNLHGLWKTVVE